MLDISLFMDKFEYVKVEEVEMGSLWVRQYEVGFTGGLELQRKSRFSFPFFVGVS